MLINLSNHPSDKWGLEQTNASISEFGHTEDIPFPAIDPSASEEDVLELAEHYFQECIDLFSEYAQHNPNDEKPDAVHIQGEFTFVHAIVNMLKNKGITCVASTSERNVIEEKDGSKTLVFNFVQFRAYFY
jgi:hypothetical protein